MTLRGPFISSLLAKLGVQPRRFWILIDLFRTLSARQEMSSWGSVGVDLKVAAGFWSIVTALASLTVIFHPNVVTYLSVFLSLTFFVLLAVLFFETAAVLINPIEGLVLAHQPINGATYTAAKLTHLLRLIVYFGILPNLVPAFAAVFGVKDARWFYPINHFAAIVTVSLFVAALWISFFGLLIRYVPSPNLKGVVHKILMIPTLALMGFRVLQMMSVGTRAIRGKSAVGGAVFASLAAFLGPLVRWPAQFFLIGQPIARESHPVVALSLGVSLAGMLMIGARSLSADYLIRVHSLVHGGSEVQQRERRSPIGALIGRLSGGQAGRAGFEYVRRMMMRDWQFIQRVVRLLPVMVGGFILLLSGASPFGGNFSPIHFAPHMIGFSFFLVSFLLRYGSEYKSGWLFLLTRRRSYQPFVRGMYLAFWLPFVLVPNLAGFLYRWTWGIVEALAFFSFSTAVTSLYLGLELQRVDGIPFSRPPKPNRGLEMDVFLLVIVRGAIATLAVALQYFLLFRSPVLFAVGILIVASAAYVSLQNSFKSMESGIRRQLDLLSTGSSSLYLEVDG